MSNWQAHLECTRLIRAHPDWDDQRVAEEAGLRLGQLRLVAEARAEVEGEVGTGRVRTEGQLRPGLDWR